MSESFDALIGFYQGSFSVGNGMSFKCIDGFVYSVVSVFSGLIVIQSTVWEVDVIVRLHLMFRRCRFYFFVRVCRGMCRTSAAHLDNIACMEHEVCVLCI